MYPEKEKFVECQSMKPYPAYKTSGLEWLGEIPAHWEVTKVKRITQLIYGESLSKDNRTEGTIPVYGSNGITGYHDEAITRNPCIIIGRKGSFGKVNYSEVKCFPIDTTFYIDNSATNHHIRWLYYLLLVLRLDSFSKDSAVPGVNREEIYEREGLIPPLTEQRAIAAYLDHKTHLIDTYLAKKQQQVVRWQAYRAALINQAVTKGLNPDAPIKASGIEWLGEIPEHWEVKKLKYCDEVIMGQSPNSEDYQLEPDGLPFLQGNADFTQFYPKPRIWCNTANKIAETDDILLSVRAPIGAVNIADQRYGIGRGLCAIRSIKTDKKYLYYIALCLSDELNSIGTGSTFTAVSVDEIRNLPISQPRSLEEQRAIAAYLDEQTAKIDTLAAATQRQLERLHAYRATLISDVVTGKIDVRSRKGSLENH